MVERKSTFKGDLKSERAVNEFLQKYLYSYLVDEGIIDSFNSNTTLDQQHKGIDTIIYIIEDGNDEQVRCINIDEKAAVHYARNNLSDEPLTTFAFEVSYMKGGELKRGWLTNEKYKETHAYFLCWLWIKSDILRKKMQKRGVNRLELEHQLDPLINALDDIPDFNKMHLKFNENLLIAKNYPQWVLTLPETLYEQPLNIVVKRKDLINLANSYWVVTPEGVEVRKSISK